jgi:hypothetical protein
LSHTLRCRSVIPVSFSISDKPVDLSVESKSPFNA